MFYIAYVAQHQEEIMGEMRNVITEFRFNGNKDHFGAPRFEFAPIDKLYKTKAGAERQARRFRIKHYPHAQEQIQVLEI